MERECRCSIISIHHVIVQHFLPAAKRRGGGGNLGVGEQGGGGQTYEKEKLEPIEMERRKSAKRARGTKRGERGKKPGKGEGERERREETGVKAHGGYVLLRESVWLRVGMGMGMGIWCPSSRRCVCGVTSSSSSILSVARTICLLYHSIFPIP